MCALPTTCPSGSRSRQKPMDPHLLTTTCAYCRGCHFIAHRYCRTLPAHPPGGGDYCGCPCSPASRYPPGRTHLATMGYTAASVLAAMVTCLPWTTCAAPATQKLKGHYGAAMVFHSGV